MIQLFQLDGNVIGLFEDFDELFHHINTIETSKLTESSSCGDIWSFSLFTNKRLSYIFYKTLEQSFSKIGKEAFDQGLDLIEISKGDYENPLQIPVTPDVNIEDLKKNWCYEYCDAHGYVIIDYSNNFGNNLSLSIPAANIMVGMHEPAKERHAGRRALL
jgi:hypothetical protein